MAQQRTYGEKRQSAEKNDKKDHLHGISGVYNYVPDERIKPHNHFTPL
jgi:hypothetical protein